MFCVLVDLLIMQRLVLVDLLLLVRYMDMDTLSLDLV